MAKIAAGTENPAEAVRDLAQQKGLNEEELWQDIADSMLAAYKQLPNSDEFAEVQLYPDTFEVEFISYENDPAGVDVTPANFGRIAAAAFKSTVAQKISEGQRLHALEKFAGRVGTLAEVTVIHTTDRRAVIAFEGIEGVLPRSEQIPGERLRKGQRVTVVITALKESGADTVVVSRTSPLFVEALLKDQVPEIRNGEVVVETVVRIPGRRTKIVVSQTNQGRGDGVAAVIGFGGQRIKSIQRELGSERVDVLGVNDDTVAFAAKALGVEASSITPVKTEDGQVLRVAIAADDASKVVGVGGSNIRLAADLVPGWKIELVTE